MTNNLNWKLVIKLILKMKAVSIKVSNMQSECKLATVYIYVLTEVLVMDLIETFMVN